MTAEANLGGYGCDVLRKVTVNPVAGLLFFELAILQRGRLAQRLERPAYTGKARGSNP